jgi:hypothetical protein
VEAVLASGLVVAMERTGSTGARGRSRALLDRIVPWALAVAPTVLFAGVFFIQGGTAGSDYRREFLTLLLGLPSLAWPLVSYDRLESVITLVLGLALFIATVVAVADRWRRREFVRRGDWALAFTIVSTIAYLVAPEALGSGGVVSQRLALFPILGLVLWLGGQEIRPRWIAMVGGASVLVAAALLVIRAPSYVSTSDAVADYLTVEPCIVPHSTMAQANLFWFPSGPLGRISPLIHDAGRLAAGTHGHDLGSITGAVPLYPLQNRATNDPFRYLITRQNGEYEIPPGLDPLGYERATDGRLDYVVLFGRQDALDETLQSTDWQSLEDQLSVGYRRIAQSPSGAVELFERASPDLMEAGDRLRTAVGGACPAAS